MTFCSRSFTTMTNRHRRGSSVVTALVATAMLPLSPAAGADPVAVINSLRANGCGDSPPVGTPVLRSRTLDDAARGLWRYYTLEEALERAGYRALSSAAYHVKGPGGDSTMRRALAERNCGSINDARYGEIGIFERGDETWIVLAVPKPEEPPLDPATVTERVLELINAARAEARRCGQTQYDPAQPLTLSPALNEAALGHARDMAERGWAGHVGSDGSQSGERITRAGYAWHASGENVAAGQRDADAVVAAWLSSPGHCATLMEPRFTETGIGFALAPEKNPAIYWTQDFAAP